MSFVSVSFLVFLPIVFCIYWLLRAHLRMQNLFLVIASYVFYGWWDWRFLILIAITSASSFASGLLIAEGHYRRFWLTANIILNVGILACFKYFNFFSENFAQLLGIFGLRADMPTLSIILPVGISFYTFQSLSYSIDVYRRAISPTRDAVAFFAYISFFPQLVAGPIERATRLLPQMLQPRTFRHDEAVDGMRRILWGLFKKMVIADNCALAVNEIWADVAGSSGATLLAGMVLFTFQIYCDFSGYSDIAIGTARLFGLRLMENFRMPYLSRSMTEFWRRWHISLMTWFRDYVYIPLGGNHCSRLRTAFNTLTVFFLSGLWHGANWTFVVWGLYNALLLLPRVFIGKSKRSDASEIATWRDLPRVVLVFLFAACGWVVFRSQSISETMTYFSCMFSSLSSFTLGTVAHGKQALFLCVLLAAIEWCNQVKTHPLQPSVSGIMSRRPLRWILYLLLVLVIACCRGDEQTFIYFQF